MNEITERICARKGCNEIGINKSGDYSKYCDRHFVVKNMRGEAQYRKLTIPSHEWIEAELDALAKNGMKCPVCKKKMVLRKKFGDAKSVLSLQHDENGKVRIICFSCNARYASIGDDFYKYGPNKKRCRHCKVAKDRKLFYFDKKSRTHSSLCKECDRLRKKSSKNKALAQQPAKEGE